MTKNDAVDLIRENDSGREPERLAMKYRNMRQNAFVFLRGTCHLFHQRLPAAELPKYAPASWACGDLHLENFGSYKADTRLVHFDINDFDEAALAPASWDLVRLATSVLTAAPVVGVSDAQAKAIVGSMFSSYADALVTGKARWIERETARGLVATLLKGLAGRRRSDLIGRRTALRKGVRRILCDGTHALAATAEQRDRAERILAGSPAVAADPKFFRVLDVARRVAGTGSLGVERYVVLVDGKGGLDGNYLLDLKQALPSSLHARRLPRQPKFKSEADRIVSLQYRMQAVPAAFLQAVEFGRGRTSRSYVLRGLQPTADRVALDGQRSGVKAVSEVVQDMGHLLAWAQLRSSGREGSANADALLEWGRARDKWQGKMLRVAVDMAARTRRDWKAFAKSYDAGELADSDRRESR